MSERQSPGGSNQLAALPQLTTHAHASWCVISRSPLWFRNWVVYVLCEGPSPPDPGAELIIAQATFGISFLFSVYGFKVGVMLADGWVVRGF